MQDGDAFGIHGFNVFDSVLVVKLGELRNIEKFREYPVSQSLRTLQQIGHVLQ